MEWARALSGSTAMQWLQWLKKRLGPGIVRQVNLRQNQITPAIILPTEADVSVGAPGQIFPEEYLINSSASHDDGLDAARWLQRQALLPVEAAARMIDRLERPGLAEQEELPAKTTDWECEYCGTVNALEQRECGQDRSGGCAGPRPIEEVVQAERDKGLWEQYWSARKRYIGRSEQMAALRAKFRAEGLPI